MHIAEKKVCACRSYRVAIRLQSLNLANIKFSKHIFDFIPLLIYLFIIFYKCFAVFSWWNMANFSGIIVGYGEL